MKVVAERAADEAVRGLYAAQWVPMVRLATMLLRDQSRAEDIVQEVFARAWREALRIVLVFLLPLHVLLAIVGNELVVAVFPERWAPAV